MTFAQALHYYQTECFPYPYRGATSRPEGALIREYRTDGASYVDAFWHPQTQTYVAVLLDGKIYRQAGAR